MSVSNREPLAGRTTETTHFWRSLLPAIRGKELSTVSNGHPHDFDFNDVAFMSADIRERCNALVERATELLALRQDFVEVFVEVAKLLSNTEGTSTALAERTALLAKELEEHGRLKSLHRALREEADRYANENSLLRSQIERFGALVSSREARILELEAVLAGERTDMESLRGELDQERAAHAEALEKLAQATTDTIRAEETILHLDSQLTDAADRASLAESRYDAIKIRLAEHQAVVTELREAFAASQQEYEKLERKNVGLEQQLAEGKVDRAVLQSKLNATELDLSAARLAHDLARSVWQEREQTVNDEMDRLKTEETSQRLRAEASEAQLATVRVELQTISALLRTKENDLEQMKGRIAPLEERAETSQREASLTLGKLLEAQRVNASLADHSQALVRGISDLKAELELSDQRVEQFESRLKAEIERAAAETEEQERRINALANSLERERTARILAVNSLEAARKNKGPRRNKLEVARTI